MCIHVWSSEWLRSRASVCIILCMECRLHNFILVAVKYCVSWIWHSYPDSSVSIYFIAPTKITLHGASCVGYVVMWCSRRSSAAFQNLEQSKSVNFLWRIRSSTLSHRSRIIISEFPPKSILCTVQGWQLECWITRIILYVWCVGLALCSHHWQWHKLKTSSIKTRPRVHSLIE